MVIARMLSAGLSFQPTLPARGATKSVGSTTCGKIFQPTLPARGATITPEITSIVKFAISTHAPRTGSDEERRNAMKYLHISTHAPRTGSDARALALALSKMSHFNPRSPHGERPCWCWSCGRSNPISTHAPRTGSDHEILANLVVDVISTHAPRTGSDENGCHEGLPSSSFQPTLPARGATIVICVSRRCACKFQPTLPARGATVKRAYGVTITCISTHAPRTGSDTRSRL